MYILVSIFAFSFLGMVSLVGYKLVVLERRAASGVLNPIPPPIGQIHSLEYHFGTFLRTLAQRYTEKGFSWIKTVCIPAIVRFLKHTTILITYIIKRMSDKLSQRTHSRGDEHIPRNGASSFFLKDITEHKKNLKNGNEH